LIGGTRSRWVETVRAFWEVQYLILNGRRTLGDCTRWRERHTPDVQSEYFKVSNLIFLQRVLPSALFTFQRAFVRYWVGCSLSHAFMARLLTCHPTPQMISDSNDGSFQVVSWFATHWTVLQISTSFFFTNFFVARSFNDPRKDTQIHVHAILEGSLKITSTVVWYEWRYLLPSFLLYLTPSGVKEVLVPNGVIWLMTRELFFPSSSEVREGRNC